MIPWMLFLQIILLMLIAYVLVGSTITTYHKSKCAHSKRSNEGGN